MMDYDTDDLAALRERELDEDRDAGEYDDTDDILDAIPALYTTPTGQIVEAETGAVLSDQDAGAMLTEMLETYRRAKVEADALAFRIVDRQADIQDGWQDELDRISAEMDAAMAGDRELVDYRARLDAAREVVAVVEATLAGMFQGRDAKVSIDTGAALVTWSVGRETWALAHPASWYATAEARRDLVNALKRLGYLFDEDADVVALASEVLAWLAPTCKVGEMPAPRITLRDGAE